MEPQEIIDAVDDILNLPENGGGVREIINALYALKSRAETLKMLQTLECQHHFGELPLSWLMDTAVGEAIGLEEQPQ